MMQKAEAAIEDSWKRTKLEALDHTTEDQKPRMERFLRDVEETSARRRNRHQNDRAKQFLGRFPGWFVILLLLN